LVCLGQHPIWRAGAETGERGKIVTDIPERAYPKEATHPEEQATMFLQNLLEKIRKKGRLPEKNYSDPQRKET